MSEQTTQLLVVDDDGFIREMLEMLLTSGGYAVTLAGDGEEAWTILDSNQHHFSAILLDRMMPRLDGMGLLARIKADSRFPHLPVIFQTANDRPQDIAEGIKAGAFYYLVKPVDKEVLFAIVRNAVNTFRLTDKLQANFNPEHIELFSLLHRVEFKLQSLSEARSLSPIIASFYPLPQRVLLGVSELIINAIEHGNLGISYQEKKSLLQSGEWEPEIMRRLTLPEHNHKKVSILLEHIMNELRLTISDVGAGFDCAEYLEMSTKRAFDPNGRGIAMSKMMSFDSLEYKGMGNQVVTVVKI